MYEEGHELVCYLGDFFKTSKKGTSPCDATSSLCQTEDQKKEVPLSILQHPNFFDIDMLLTLNAKEHHAEIFSSIKFISILKFFKGQKS